MYILLLYMLGEGKARSGVGTAGDMKAAGTPGQAGRPKEGRL
jgi:hypothetical protein